MSTAAEKPMRTAFAPDPWVQAIICHPSMKRSAENVAWLLSSDAAFTTDGCTAGDVDIASQLGLARNSVKNALILLRVHGFIRWSWSSTDGARIRTIHPAVVQDATTSVNPAVCWGDAPAPTAVATPLPAKDPLRRRGRRSRSDEVVRPMPEPPADRAFLPASMDSATPDIACVIPDRTQSGCDANPALGHTRRTSMLPTRRAGATFWACFSIRRCRTAPKLGAMSGPFNRRPRGVSRRASASVATIPPCLSGCRPPPFKTSGRRFTPSACPGMRVANTMVAGRGT